MTLIGYDPDRVRVLHRTAGRVVGELSAVRSDDPAAAGPMAAVRAVHGDLEDRCLALAERILASDAMLAFSALGLGAVIGQWVLKAVRSDGGGLSTTDVMLVRLLRHFDELDTDLDGEVSGNELTAGLTHPDPLVAESCAHLLDRPLVMLNMSLAETPWWQSTGSQDVEVGDVTLTATSIAATLADNHVLRVLADPALFAALDAEKTGEIDGAVSKEDVQLRLARETDPEVRQSLELLLAADVHGRIDRDHIGGTSNGLIAYDQVYGLGVHQGAFDGLPDPAIPPALRQQFDAPEFTADRTAQFLHHPIPPQPGMGQVMIALFIPADIAGAPGPHVGKSAGNDRGPDPHAHPSDSKGWAVVDYETGMVTVRVNPSCSASAHDACQDPLPISTDFSPPMAILPLVPIAVGDSKNRVSITPRPDRTDIRFGITNSDKRLISPRLDAKFEVRTHDDGTASVDWDRDDFPDLESVYHVYPDGQIVRLIHAHSGPSISLFGIDGEYGSERG